MKNRSNALSNWLSRRAEQWNALGDSLRHQAGRKDYSVKEAMNLVAQFRGLARDISLARHVLPQSHITRYLETLFVKTHEIIYQKPRFIVYEISRILTHDVPYFVRRERLLIAATFGLFILTGVAGWNLVAHYPELAGLFASEEMINKVQQGELWTDNLLNIIPSSLLSLSIMTNNIVVAITAFALGAFYGLGTLYIIGLNGLMLGGIFAFTHQYNLSAELFKFVIAHGVVELSVICLAGAAGIGLGEALIRPGRRKRGAAFQHAVKDGGKLVLVCVLFLVGAGVIEGYVSPDPQYSLSARVTIGVLYGVVLLAVLSGVLRSRQSRDVRARQQL